MSEEISCMDLFRCRNTILELLEYRGFINNKIDFFMTYDYFTEIYKIWLENESILDIYINNHVNKCYVHFRRTKMVFPKKENKNQKKGTIHFYKMAIKLDKYDTLVFVLTNKDIIINKINIYETSYPLIQFFEWTHLLFNVTNHNMVPNHRILSIKEKENILSKYQMKTVSKLPKISKNDPVAKFIGMRIGDVCEITRSSKVKGGTKRNPKWIDAGKNLYYRTAVQLFE